MQSIRTLMTEIIDYAGLFPPAKLDMRPAVENYAAYRDGDFAWMLSRFICPVSRFGEFETAAAPFLSRLVSSDALPEGEAGGDAGDGSDDEESGDEETTYYPDAWLLSAICQIEDVKPQVEAIFDLMERQDGRVIVDAIEVKISRPGQVDEVLDVLPEAITPFFEFPLTGDIRGFATAISGTAGGAKIRTGGVTPDLVPSPEQVAAFIKTCAQADVPFKATAGLHHPLRHHDPTVGADMFGFLNVFLAGLLAGDLSEQEMRTLLDERNLGAFDIREEGIGYGGRFLASEHIEHGRSTRCLSYGSCSFVEPIDDLRSLKLL